MPAGSKYWISEGMLGTEIYNVDNDHDGCIDHVRFSLKNKFLHPNHPLGWIRKITVVIDGQEMDPENTCFVLRDQFIPLKYVPTIRDIWWGGTETAWIHAKSCGLRAGEEHRVQCTMEVSLMVHNKNIDRKDEYGRLICELEEKMRVSEGENV